MRSVKIQNDHSSRSISGNVTYYATGVGVSFTTLNLTGEIIEPIILNWNIGIDHQEDWWQISSESPIKGTLNPGEYQIVTVEVDRTGKAPGEYRGSFMVEASGNNYDYGERVNLIMQVDSYLGFKGLRQRDKATKNYIQATEECVNNVFLNSEKEYLSSNANQTQDSSTISIVTDSIGNYNISRLQKGHSYTVTPFKNEDIFRTSILMSDACLAAQLAAQLLSEPTEAQRIAADVDTNGIISINDANMIAQYTIGLPEDESQVGKWLFLPNQRSYTRLDSIETDQNFAAVVVGDVDGNWHRINSTSEKFEPTQDYHVSIASIKTASDDTIVVIPIVIDENLTGQKITSYTAEISWDTLVINNPSASQIGTMTELWGSENYYQNNTTPGKLIWGQFSISSPLSGSGTLVNIVFDVIGNPGDSSLISINFFTINGIEAAISDGFFTINNPPSVDSVMIFPTNPLDVDSLIANYTYHDHDGDPEIGTKITWYKNDEIQSSYVNELIIPSSAITAGEQWYVTIRPNDGFEFGNLKTSQIVIIKTSKVIADFSADTTFGVDSLNVQFMDRSQGQITSWYWDFGDGTFSIEQNPIHTFYDEQKHYNVSLTVTGPWASDTMKKDSYITVYQKVITNLNAFPIVGQSNLSVRFTNNTTGDANHFLWNFGDGTKLIDDNKQNPMHAFETIGDYTIAFKAWGDGGIDSVTYNNLICVDDNATELVVVNSGIGEANHNWDKAIDHNVISHDGIVVTSLDNSWAIFAFANSFKREITKFRLKRAIYHNHNIERKAKSFEILISIDSTNFNQLLAEEFVTDDWAVYELTDSVCAKYIMLKILNTNDPQSDTCEFAEFQVFGIPVETTEVKNSENSFTNFPLLFSLANNYPNPFNNTTIINYVIPDAAEVFLLIYNVQGQVIKTLVNGLFQQGSYQIIWDGTDERGRRIGSGIYICYMRAINNKQEIFSDNHKMILLK